ncbi:hypothetical protein Mapa_000442 [Marchantia paleacea]|nr:hypothetical protein Mapa_000442 [Marchantia paleacea]
MPRAALPIPVFGPLLEAQHGGDELALLLPPRRGNEGLQAIFPKRSSRGAQPVLAERVPGSLRRIEPHSFFRRVRSDELFDRLQPRRRLQGQNLPLREQLVRSLVVVVADGVAGGVESVAGVELELGGRGGLIGFAKRGISRRRIRRRHGVGRVVLVRRVLGSRRRLLLDASGASRSPGLLLPNKRNRRLVLLEHHLDVLVGRRAVVAHRPRSQGAQRGTRG